MEFNIFDMRKICGFYDENRSEKCMLSNAVIESNIFNKEDYEDLLPNHYGCSSLSNCPLFAVHKSIEEYNERYSK